MPEQVRSTTVPVDGPAHVKFSEPLTQGVVHDGDGRRRRVTLAFVVALTAGWFLFGWWRAFPNEWFLTTNLVMTLAVFMIPLLLQHERKNHMRAIHAKLDELIRSIEAGNHSIAA